MDPIIGIVAFLGERVIWVIFRLLGWDTDPLGLRGDRNRPSILGGRWSRPSIKQSSGVVMQLQQEDTTP